MEDEKEDSMSAPLRLLISVIGIGAMFALGRLVRSQLQLRAGAAAQHTGRPKLRALPSPVVPEDQQTEVQKEGVDPNKIMIHVPPAQVYERARKLEYFEKILAPLDLQMSVIIDQPGEFFGVRVEHEAELYGTVLVHLEEVPGKDGGTEVSVSVKYKHDFGVYPKQAIEDGVNKEIGLYLSNLKEVCEKELADKAATI